MRALLRLAWYASIIVFAIWLVALGAVIAWGSRDRAQRSDAIVVLGAAQYWGRPSPVLRARLDHAVGLYRRGMAPRVVLTGGVGVGDTTSEAAVSRKYVIGEGIPDSAILLETTGRTTRESLRSVARMLQSGQDRRVILVSDPFHMLRLDILARRFGLVPYTSPTRTSPISANTGETWRYYITESLKIPFVLVMERPRS
ncbi:MAG: YdcF family protein [Gemmatimonadaceae bacterium]